MKRWTLIGTTLLIMGQQAMAQTAAVRAKVIGAESRLNIGSVKGSDIGSQLDTDGNTKSQSAFGGGAELEFGLSEPLHVGVGLAFTPFEDDKDLAYSDLEFSGFGSYDFLQQDVLTLYGKAGLSYHQISFDDRTAGPLTASYDATSLLNYDLGLGARFKLSHQLNFGLEYKYTDTFSRNDVGITYAGLGLVSNNEAELKNVAFTSNELVASLGYSF